MADNFLEKRQQDYNANAAKSARKQSASLASLMRKSRSCRGYDNSFMVRTDQLRRIIAANTFAPSSRNRQALRFRMVLADEACLVLPHVRMGAALPQYNLPIAGTEPNAFIVVCTTEEPSASLYIDVGISVQSMLLQAAEIGLNALCIGSFDSAAVSNALGLSLQPLIIMAVGKGVEKFSLVEISPDESRNYYRKNGVHYVPKLRVDDLIL